MAGHDCVGDLVAREFGNTTEVLPHDRGVDWIRAGIRTQLVSRRAQIRQVGSHGLDEQLQTIGRDATAVTPKLPGHPLGQRPALLQRLALDGVRRCLLQVLECCLPAAPGAMVGHDQGAVSGGQKLRQRVSDGVGLGHHQDRARPEEVLTTGLGQAQPDVGTRAGDLLHHQIWVVLPPLTDRVLDRSGRQERVRPGDQNQRHLGSSDVLKAAMKASCGTSTRPTIFIRFLPSFCFSSSLRLRVMSPP